MTEQELLQSLPAEKRAAVKQYLDGRPSPVHPAVLVLLFVGAFISSLALMCTMFLMFYSAFPSAFAVLCGALFAAWPMVYATAFSGFYWAMLVILIALILRPLAFDYRSKVPAQKWRSSWDWALFAGSVIPPVICGVAFGNLLQGVPFHLDETLRPIYTGNFFGLLNPFGLLCGVTGLLMMVCHGANYLVLRTDGDLQRRAASVGLLRH